MGLLVLHDLHDMNMKKNCKHREIYSNTLGAGEVVGRLHISKTVTIPVV
jgi:hypothetical protein